MKVILKEEYVELGGIGEVVNVAGGYARNYLIPQGIAVVASKGNLKQFEAEKDSLLKKKAALKAGSEETAAAIAELELSFTRKAGEDDRLFGSVTSMDLAAALAENKIEIDKRNIVLDEHIKSLGETSVKIKLPQGVTAALKVVVEKE